MSVGALQETNEFLLLIKFKS